MVFQSFVSESPRPANVVGVEPGWLGAWAAGRPEPIKEMVTDELIATDNFRPSRHCHCNDRRHHTSVVGSAERRDDRKRDVPKT